jgi:hypothetical protein
MVTLAARLSEAFASPVVESNLVGAELFALARWYRETGGEAEMTLQAALSAGLQHDLRLRALREMALWLKREGRRGEAAEWWQQLAIEDRREILAPVELAKTFEWHIHRLDLAIGWTRLALRQVERWAHGRTRDRAREEVEHRLARLEGKRERENSKQRRER